MEKYKIKKAIEKGFNKKTKIEPISKRQIIIETDGQNINILKNECSHLELQAILGLLLKKLTGNN